MKWILPVLLLMTLRGYCKADLVIFSYDRPLQLYACLESIQEHVTDVDRMTVIYRASKPAFAHAYKQVEAAFPKTFFVVQKDPSCNDFKPLVINTVFDHPSPYVAFVVDDIIVKDTICFKECIEVLEKTGAYGFFLRLGTHVDICYALNTFQGIPSYTQLTKSICSWQFQTGLHDWKYPNTLDMTLYRKADIKADLLALSYKNPNTLESEWARYADLNKTGLFYNKSKIVNIPLNIVSTFSNRNMSLYSKFELLEKFKQGLKIDIAPLFQIENKSAHLEYEPSFILR